MCRIRLEREIGKPLRTEAFLSSVLGVYDTLETANSGLVDSKHDGNELLLPRLSPKKQGEVIPVSAGNLGSGWQNVRIGKDILGIGVFSTCATGFLRSLAKVRAMKPRMRAVARTTSIQTRNVAFFMTPNVESLSFFRSGLEWLAGGLARHKRVSRAHFERDN